MLHISFVLLKNSRLKQMPNMSCICFSSPELKAQVSFADHLLSVVRLSICPLVCLSVCPSVCKLHNFIFFSRTNLGTKYPWVMGIHVSSNEGPHFFSMGDYNEIAKIHWPILEIFFLKTTRPNSTSTEHPDLKSCLFKWKAMPFSKGR